MIIDYFTQICLAIKHLHDRKILHRDLKSQNIFLTKDGIVKLGDFGIAKVLSHTKENLQTIVGTPYYLSPEIVENKPYNYKSDIWSLGVLLYEMLCLEPPFNGTSLTMLAMRIVKGNYKAIPKRYSTKIGTLVKAILNPDSEKRPSVNKILKMDIISNRARELLDEEKYIQEFSHTVLHNMNIFQQVHQTDEEPHEESPSNKPAKKSGFEVKAQIEMKPKGLKKKNSRAEPKAEPNKEEDVLGAISDVIGDLKDKNILATTGFMKPVKKAQSKPKVVKKPWEEAKLKPKPKSKTAKVTSQWEIREELAKKKRESIYAEVRRKREKEQERLKVIEQQKEEEKQQKEKDRSDRVRKEKRIENKMKEDLKKKRQAIKNKSKDSMDFEFVGPTYGEPEESEEPSIIHAKDSKAMYKAMPVSPEDEYQEVEFVHNQITSYQNNLMDFLETENVSDEEAEMATPAFRFVPTPSEDRDNVYNNGLDESEDLDSPKKVTNLKTR
eukprot:CAMPEP_0197017808 /NCGR_PEP_ID=MMETSP1380-20130617/79751_1 /TAXON_ID=5936 /ORGANISM="Euplotes crassus, Strain CT5" /LENGTH=495 /DNA_ID=CAMNT_0042444957 /DNA_START=115 /DNA_END=1603 /DNA_ORIENTATION=-